MNMAIKTTNIWSGSQSALKFLFTLMFILALSSANSHADMIRHAESKSDTIRMGLCLVDESRNIFDSLETSFFIDNTRGNSIKIGESNVSFAIKLLEGYPGEFQEFSVRKGDIPSTVFPDDTKEIVLKYLTKPSLIAYPPGKKHCAVRFGVYDPSQITPPLDEDDLIEFKDYILIAKKTTKYIDSFYDKVDFDTVYVKPPETIEKYWTAENLSGKDINIDEEHFLRINSDAEIDHYGYGFDYVFPKDTSKTWLFTYYPEGPGPDSAVMILNYRPHPDSFPDSTESKQIKIKGFGALQQINIINTDGAEFSNDTINLGEIPAGTEHEVIASFRNNGNIPFGIVSENIFKDGLDLISTNYQIIDPLYGSGKDILPGIVKNMRFKFSANKKGTYTARYEIKSDINNRNIYGYPQNAGKVQFFITAKAVEPVISFASDTVDFGNIVIHRDCPVRRDTSIFIANSGNTDLSITNIFLEPDPPAPFLIDTDNMEIAAGKQELFDISFSTQAQTPDTLFLWKLVFVSNSNPPLDTFELNLKARGIEPYPVDLSLPDMRSKTGRVLTCPILVEKDRIWRAKTFDTRLSYNNTLLRFYNYQSFGTGSDGARVIDIDENIEKQELELKIEMPSGVNFGPSDTLIFLKFSTFLGNEASTPIAFINPIFGDGNCPKALNPNIRNGNFQLDSICGLEYKTVPLPDGEFFVSKIAPNPVINNASFIFHLPEETKIEIDLFNSFGDKISSIDKGMLAGGDHERTINCNKLQPGVYFIRFQADSFSETINFVLTK